MVRRKLYLSLYRRMNYALQHSEAYQRTGNVKRCPGYRNISRILVDLHYYLTDPVTQN